MSASKFWKKVKIGKPDECWEWQGYIDKETGYGRFGFKTKVNSAHRFAWEITFGPIPDGKMVCHSCDNRVCQNPSHLFLGTAADNNADMREKGRGSNPPVRSKITPEQVRQIRTLWVPYRFSVRKISELMKLPYKAVECAVNPHKWKSVL